VCVHDTEASPSMWATCVKMRPKMMVSRLPTWTPTSLGASLLMLPCEFGGTLIHWMSSNGHRKIGRPEISSSRKTVAPKNRSRAMLQDHQATHPRPWALDLRCQLQSYRQIQSTDREIHSIQGYAAYRISTWVLFRKMLHRSDQYMKT